MPWRFFLLTFAISWSAWLAALAANHVRPDSGLVLALQVIGSFGPTIAAFLMTSQEGGGPSVVHLLRRGLPSRVPLRPLLLIALIPLGVNGAAYWLAGGRNPNFAPLTIIGTFVLYFFLGGSVGEEFGWRGYALDRLQRRCSWLASSIVLGLVWGVWHYPLSLMPSTTQSSTPQWVFLLSTTSLAVIMTWIYNLTQANLFGMLLLHTFENITVMLFPPEVVAGVDRAAHYQAWIMVAVALLLLTAGAESRAPGSEVRRPRPGR